MPTAHIRKGCMKISINKIKSNKTLYTVCLAFAYCICANLSLSALDYDKKLKFIGSAYAENASYKLLETICNEIGGRLAGSQNCFKTHKLLSDKLKEKNIKQITDKYNIPGWQRGKNTFIKLVSPEKRQIIGFTIGFSPATAETELKVTYAKAGFESDYNDIDVRGKAVIIDLDNAHTGENLTRGQSIKIAADKGAKAVLFPGNKDSAMVLISSGSLSGEPLAVPAFTISRYDGDFIRNEIKKGKEPIISIASDDTCKSIIIQNLRAIFPGRNNKKILVIAHYDSWDISQGAIDNGLGTSILFDISRLIKSYFPDNYYTIECVWTDAEELGLYGAKKLAESIADSVAAVINIDMTGTPTGINIMGFDNLADFSNNFIGELRGYRWTDGVKSNPWLRSDHAPFLIKGIPSVTFFAYMEKEMYWNYHSTGDNFDKVNPKYMSDAASIIGLYAVELANYKDIENKKLNFEQTVQMLKKNKLDIQLKKTGEWIGKEK